MSYEHPGLGLSFALPPGWEVVTEMPLTAIAPTGGAGGFRANVTFSAVPAREEEPVERWHEEALAAMLPALVDARLIDRERDGGVQRTLVHHVVEGRPVVAAQWWLEGGGRRWVVTASSAPEDAESVLAEVEPMIDSLELG